MKGPHVNRFWLALALMACGMGSPAQSEPIDLGDRRELMVDRYLIEKTKNVRLKLAEPHDEGVALQLDKPWEGAFCGYFTILKDGGKIRVYYRAKPESAPDGKDESTCMAESADGLHWARPSLGLIEFRGSKDNNLILGNVAQVTHNFAPMLDANPAAPADQRYKALAGTLASGLVAFVSPDGIRWKKLREEPVMTRQMIGEAAPGFGNAFDSQNLAFWSPTEKRYVAYYRVTTNKTRRIARAHSADFIHWENIQMMEYRGEDGMPAPIEHLYTNQTAPYFRAPHILISTAARFMPGRQVLTDEQAKEIHVNPKYFKDTSDAVLLSSRGGNIYDRTFLSSLIRPGIGAHNWVSRTNYPAHNVIQTGEHELSIYVNQDYAQPTAHLRRYSLRIDGFASLRAEYAGGEMTTRPLTFTGKKLQLNFSTSAAGGIRVEIQDESGKPLPGYAAADCVETIGNEIERTVRWKKVGDDLSAIAGKTVRLRFVMKDADLYALRFANN